MTNRQQIEGCGVPVDFKIGEEPWTIINVADGSIIKTRLIIMSVVAIYDDNSQHIKGPDGQLLYAFEHTLVHKVISSPLLLAETGSKQ